jgi:hypothetical protein
LWSLALSGFLTLFHKRHDFRGGGGEEKRERERKKEKVIEYKMCVLIFSATVIRNISHFKKSSARYCHKCANVFM